MDLRIITLLLGCLLSWAGIACSSEEEYILLKEVTAVSYTNEQTGGPIMVRAQVDERDGSFTELSIEVFDRRFEAGPDDLLKLKGMPLTSLVITHEAGYERTGGHTVYLKMSALFSGTKKTVTVSVSEQQGLSVSSSEILENKF